MMTKEKDVLVYNPGDKINTKFSAKAEEDQSERSAQAYLIHKESGNS